MAYQTRDDLPASYDEFLTSITQAGPDGLSLVTYELAEAFGALNECRVGGEKIINADSFAHVIGEHYGVDDPHDVEAAVLNSELETGADGDSGICSYHAGH